MVRSVSDALRAIDARDRPTDRPLRATDRPTRDGRARLARTRPADLRATGEIVWVYADLAAGRAQALPDWLREQLRPLAGAGAGET